MSANGHPSAREQAEQILEWMREDGVDVPDWADVETVAQSVDESKPTSVNYSQVTDELFGEL